MNQMITAALATAERAKPKVPVPVEELMKLAGAFCDEERLSEAEGLLDHIVSAVPDAPSALHLKGIVQFRTGRHAAAAAMIERALELQPDAAVFRRDLCPIYERLGRYEDALRVGHQALERDPCDLQTLHNLALVHHRRLELDESTACARRALAIDPTMPGPHFQLAESLLLRGELAKGWREYRWRFRIAGASQPLPPNDRPQWDGAPLPGATLLLVADQGLGDAIQFSRYIPWACERCPDVVVAADPLMHPLIRQIHPAIGLLDRWDKCPPFAAYCPLTELPRLHGTTLDRIPNKVPYLHPDPARAAVWRARLRDLIQPGYRRVGIVWAGRPTHRNDFNRSTRLAALAPIAALDDIALVSLQKGAEQAAIAARFDRAPLLNVAAEIEDFVDTMAVVAALDLVVTVDTSVAHLAGAMGRPVWILLPYAPDWRWLLDRSDSPWYPSARLFRQWSPGDWDGLARQVAQALSAPGSVAAAESAPRRDR